ncbi:ABC transporter ATP-binding protein [Yinghuangia aomiensis]|uniref:ABC transporter ATP-binding protein n=1 Tax=Yinghuangia aomiensis TaxID=676205 RepID=A0ABP9GMI4_9ACTN
MTDETPAPAPLSETPPTRQRRLRLRRQEPIDDPGRAARELFGGRLVYDSGYTRHDDTWETITLRQMARSLPASLRKTVALAWSADRAAVLVVFGAELAEGIAGAFGLLAANSAMVELFAAGPTPDRVRASFPALLAIGLAAILGQIFAGISTIAAGRLEPKVERAADEELLRCTIRVELQHMESPEFAKLLDAARSGCDSARAMLGHAVGITGAVISLIAAGGVLTVLHPVLLPMLLLIVVPHAYGTLATSRRGYASRRAWRDNERMLDQISWYLTSQHAGQELRVHAAGDHLIDKFSALSDDSEREQVRLARATAATNWVAAAASGLATGATYVVLGWLLLTSRVPLATAGTAVLAIRSGSSGLRNVVQQAARLFAETLWFDDFRTACTEAEQHATPSGGLPVPGAPAVIDVRDVTFTYPDKATPALDKVNVTIPRGSVVALVGENGSGKSTLAKVIAAVYAPDSGAVTWDGVDVRDLDRDDVYAHVGLVTQEFVRFPFTSGYNIRIGRLPTARGTDGPQAPTDLPTYDNDPVFHHAIATANADTLLPDLPQGWNTLASRSFAGGVQLSGGQWQKLALARGVYRQAALLILDEPTAALDPAAEIAAYDKVRVLADAGHTVVLISHRMASTRRADQIVVLDRGRVVESGTWDELMALDGAFRRMFDIQARELQIPSPTTPPDGTSSCTPGPEVPDARRGARPVPTPRADAEPVSEAAGGLVPPTDPAEDLS